MRSVYEGLRSHLVEYDPRLILAENRSQGGQAPRGRELLPPYALPGVGKMKPDVRRSANLRPVYVREGCLSSSVSLYGQYTNESIGSKHVL